MTDELYGPLDVTEDMTLQDLIALLEFECGFDATKHDILHKTRHIGQDTQKTLQELELVNDELLVIRSKLNHTNSSGASGPVGGSLAEDMLVEQFRQQVITNPDIRSQILGANPGFENVINDPAAFRESVGRYILQSLSQRGPQNPFGIPQNEYDTLMRNPDDPENQKRISELISQQEIDEQMQNAMEFTPEVFTPVHMLYINLEINGFPVKAFVDSGAQTTFISTKLAEKTGLTRLIDKRFSGEVRGVGVQKKLGKIHIVQVKIETQYVPCSLTVMDTDVDMLLGLDMLKRHQAVIDLKDNVLQFAGVKTSFLSEAEIPKDFDAEIVDATAAGQKIDPPKVQDTPLRADPQTPTPKAFPDAVVRQLMDLGFSKEETLRALEQSQGNPDMAAALLFQ